MISQFNLFRYVDGTTVVHRADARPKVLGLTVLDHVIIGETRHDPHGLGFYSFADNGLI